MLKINEKENGYVKLQKKSLDQITNKNELNLLPIESQNQILQQNEEVKVSDQIIIIPKDTIQTQQENQSITDQEEIQQENSLQNDDISQKSITSQNAAKSFMLGLEEVKELGFVPNDVEQRFERNRSIGITFAILEAEFKGPFLYHEALQTFLKYLSGPSSQIYEILQNSRSGSSLILHKAFKENLKFWYRGGKSCLHVIQHSIDQIKVLNPYSQSNLQSINNNKSLIAKDLLSFVLFKHQNTILQKHQQDKILEVSQFIFDSNNLQEISQNLVQKIILDRAQQFQNPAQIENTLQIFFPKSCILKAIVFLLKMGAQVNLDTIVKFLKNTGPENHLSQEEIKVIIKLFGSSFQDLPFQVVINLWKLSTNSGLNLTEFLQTENFLRKEQIELFFKFEDA